LAASFANTRSASTLISFAPTTCRCPWVIDRVRDSTNEVGGRLIELGGAEYMIRGLGYLRSLSDLETVPVANKNGTPVLVRDLGSVSFGPDIRRGVAEWNGEGEAVGGIVVMRYGQNALNVILGVKQKIAQISASLPTGVEIVSGYDRSGLIEASIDTLQRDLVEEAVIVSVIIIIFLSISVPHSSRSWRCRSR
jgi:Cu(I)/Ag(I) efflux system membrane protein CusA/SilA